MTTEQLIHGRIQQMKSRQQQYEQKARVTKCLQERIRMKAGASRTQAILDEYTILMTQIKQNR